MLRVGFIGLGAMGIPMARNILRAGFPLTVWARRREAAEPLLADGAKWASSAAGLARESDVVITIVTNSPDVREVVTGPGGILEGAREGLVVVDMSTIAPSVSREIAAEAGERGVAFLDAPVSGGTQGAEAGTLTIMVGGDADALETARPVLEAMGKRIFHVGPSGSGEVVKLVNNSLVGVIGAATGEALVLGAKEGVDVGTMAEVIGVSTGASWQLANQFPLRVFNGSFQPGFMTDLLAKDLGLALNLGAESEVPLPLTAVARQLYVASQAAGYGRDDYTSVVRLFEEPARAELRTRPGRTDQ
ncbi:MAG TPA: NAD(P)-dependent oxidoreductase [Chloroflexota bacterium]|nr:NAD(P)-dependent oxidoreductase [Chloroflexota bacterium]